MMRASRWLPFAAWALLAAGAFAQDAGQGEAPIVYTFTLVWNTEYWGPALVAFSAGIVLLIVMCTTGAGNAFRASSGQALAKLPPKPDAEGLAELRDRAESGPLHRAIKVGLVSGRGGLLISKSAVLSAWEAEKSRFKQWPRVLLALGLISLALGLLSASDQLPKALTAWLNERPYDQYRVLNHAHALLTWGMTNCFVSLLLFFLFDRVTQAFLDRGTLNLVRYLGNVGEGEALILPAPEPRRAAQDAGVR